MSVRNSLTNWFLILGFALSLLSFNRIFFVLSFFIVTIITLPVEVWFGMKVIGKKEDSQ